MLRRLALLPAFVSLLLAQEPPADPFGHSRHGAEFDEGPRRAAYLMLGLSEQVHFPVPGLGEEAQRYFEQALCQQHGFWFFEAERSFRQVAKLQPDCALAYWGMALANVENWQRAAGFACQAVQRAAGLGEREKLYVDAIAALYQIDDALRTELQSGDAERIKKARRAVLDKKDRDEKKLARAYLKGLEAVVAACPDDVEAKALLAIQSWRNTDHGIEISSHGAVDALLAQVFERAPRHPAHHYRVHLWDSEKAERALRSAAALGDSAPGIAHQWHMAGHIYAKLNRHAEAAWQQEASGRVDHAHMQRDRVMPFLIHNYGHNQEWLARSLSLVGDAPQALAIAKNLAELPRHPKFNKVETGDDIAGYARARLVSVCEDHELWAEAVALCHDGFLERSESIRAEVQRLGLLGRALFRLGRLEEGKAVQAEVVALLAKARAARAEALDRAETEAFAKKEPSAKTLEAMAEAGREPSSTVRSVLDLQRELQGELLLASGDAKAALVEFEAVGDLPKTLLADAHVAAGQVDKAIELLEKEVKERPKRVPTLGRLLVALHASDKPEHKERARIAMGEVIELVGAHQDDLTATPLLRRLAIGVEARPSAQPRQRTDSSRFPADFGPRPPLASLGPVAWTPQPHPGFDLPRVGGERLALAAGAGKPTLVVFYLGFGCLHCVEQLHALRGKHAAFAAAGIGIVAIGDDPLDKAAQALADLPAEQRFPFPLLADPERATFRAFHCFDDFEDLPLHGTFLVDADGRVRWQDLGAEPFLQLDWLLTESQRLLALPAQAGGR
jgi:peroxiredoxin/tetratricopeptide (TPR) repeat protein